MGERCSILTIFSNTWTMKLMQLTQKKNIFPEIVCGCPRFLESISGWLKSKEFCSMKPAQSAWYGWIDPQSCL